MEKCTRKPLKNQEATRRKGRFRSFVDYLSHFSHIDTRNWFIGHASLAFRRGYFISTMKKNVIGLWLSEHVAQAVWLELVPPRSALLAVAEWENTLFDYAGDDTPGVDEFVDRLSQFTSGQNQRTVDHVSAAIDSSMLFINTIPVLQAASSQEIDAQVQWEVAQYFPGVPPDAFLTDTHTLSRVQSNEHKEILTVTIRRDHTRKLQRACSRLKLRLDVVDVDHFSAESALRENYPEVANKQLALVGIKKERMDVSVMRYSDLETYFFSANQSTTEMVQQLSRLAKSTKGLSSITLYGSELTMAMLGHARNTTDIPVELLNPLRSIDVATSLRSNSDITSASHRYAAAIGVALRRE